VSDAGGAPQSEPRAPRFVTSLLLAIGIWAGVGVAFYCAVFLVFMATLDLNSTLGLGPIDDLQATAVFRTHRDDCENLRRWLLRDVGVTDPLRDPLPERFREEYAAALSRIGAYGMRRERIESGGLRLAIHLGCYGCALGGDYTDLVWTDGPPPVGREPTADNADFTKFMALEDGWFVRRETN
jgi:hypothetical protein